MRFACTRYLLVYIAHNTGVYARRMTSLPSRVCRFAKVQSDIHSAGAKYDSLVQSFRKIDGAKVATLQLLPWATGRRSGTDVMPITNAIVPGCLLPVCFPFMLVHIGDVTRYSPQARLRMLSFRMLSCLVNLP